MLHMNSDLMGPPGFKYTLHQSDIPQTFKYPVMSYSMLANCWIGHYSHLHSIFRVTGKVTDNSTLVLFYNAPYQCTIFTFGCFIKELYSQIGLCIRCFSYNQ